VTKRCLYSGRLPEVDRAVQHLSEHNIELVMSGRGREETEEEMLALVEDVDGSIAGSSPYTAKVLRNAPRLKVIARAGVGYDRIDVQAATSLGIQVTITPIPELSYAMAEHTFALMLSLLKQVPYLNETVRRGAWVTNQTWALTSDLYDRKLGLLGLGRIGSEVAQRAKSFRMSVSYYDLVRRRDLEDELGISYVPLDELLSESDIVSVHVSLNDKTRGMIDGKAIGRMKKTAILINTARGPIIDQVALADALQKHRIAGAGLDVLREEPPSEGDPLHNLQDRIPNLILTPHSGVSGPTLNKMVMVAAEEVTTVLEGGRPRYPVNNL
jgi:lactate dehydrogenase-like 2-hydroxyacid dehydrogenase